MNGPSFDDFARRAIVAIPRRPILRALGAAAVTAMLARFASLEAAAACGKVGTKCRRSRECCRGGVCRHGRCRCRDGFTNCDGRCRCGTCDTTCERGDICLAGRCSHAPGGTACAAGGCGSTPVFNATAGQNIQFCSVIVLDACNNAQSCADHTDCPANALCALAGCGPGQNENRCLSLCGIE